MRLKRRVSSLGLALTLSTLVVLCSAAQEVDLKKKALAEFESENYNEAVSLLKEAVQKNPQDAELYFYLGYFTHYLCYDSVPLTGFEKKVSDEILSYFEKAVGINPKLGDAYYFIGAEWGARSHQALHRGDVADAISALRSGREKGGYPDWLVEYGRNMLRSCELNAILFTGGDADTNPLWYLQFVENYRKDVTVIPVAFLDRPWFVRLLKTGFRNLIVPAPISWSEEQIMDMHPYKWKTVAIRLPLPRSPLGKNATSFAEKEMEWELTPDLTEGDRQLLSPARALIADIVKTNEWKRPIYFSVACSKEKIADLDKHLQEVGLTRKVMPVEVAKYDISLDAETIEKVLLQPDHYQFLPSVKSSNMPRVSGMLQNYRSVLLRLATYYKDLRKASEAKEVLNKMEQYVPSEVFPLSDAFENYIKNLRSQLMDSRR